jgi:hypothetical protein
MHEGTISVPSRSAAEPSPNTDAPPNARGQGACADYDRARDLPRLVGLWPHEIEGLDAASHALLLAKLRMALRGERKRGAGGHWTYDVVRHARLVRAYRAEVALFLARARS